MILLTNKQLSNILYECERLINSGASRLEQRKHIQQGIREINQGLGGLDVVKKALDSSADIKTFIANY